MYLACAVRVTRGLMPLWLRARCASKSRRTCDKQVTCTRTERFTLGYMMHELHWHGEVAVPTVRRLVQLIYSLI